MLAGLARLFGRVPLCALGPLLLAGAAWLLPALPGLRLPAPPGPLSSSVSGTAVLTLLLPALCLALLLAPRIGGAARHAMHRALAAPSLHRESGLPPALVQVQARREATAWLLDQSGSGCGLLISLLVGVEMLFAWPGLGMLLANAILTRDLLLTGHTALCLVGAALLGRFAAALCRPVFDPRAAIPTPGGEPGPGGGL